MSKIVIPVKIAFFIIILQLRTSLWFGYANLYFENHAKMQKPVKMRVLGDLPEWGL